MKNIILIIACLICVLGCSQKETANESERTVLRIGTDATYPPFETINTETGKPEGFDIDLITEICKVNNWKPEFIVTPFDGIIPGLNNNKYDVVISAMTITPERAAVVKFSDPYYFAGQVLAVGLNNDKIKSIKDLTGKRVGVQLGTTGEIMAKKMEGIQVFSFDNIGAAFIDMDNGNLDAVLNDFPTTQAYIDKHGTAKMVGEILSNESYGIAVRATDTELLKKINNALKMIKTDERYLNLHMKWFHAPPVKSGAIVDSLKTE